MNVRMNILVVALLVGTMAVGGAAYGDMEDVAKVFRLIPADTAVAVVVVDAEKLDATITSLEKRLDPEAPAPELLEEFKDEWPMAEWVDFGSPLCVVGPGLAGGGDELALWARIPDFAARVKSLPGAKEEAGVWHVVFNETENVYAKQRGDYVAMAMTLPLLEMATKEGKSLAEEMRSRVDLLRGRDVLIHVNMDPLREPALAGVAQAAQMAPMIAMGLGPQIGMTDPMALSRMIDGYIEGVEKFMRQLAYVDIVASVGSEAIDVTIVSGYREGAIKDYLSKQRPASATLLSDIEAQPYVAAMAYHLPGDKAPFFDLVFDKTLSALQAPPAAASPTGEQAAPAPKDPAITEALELACELYRKMEGMEVVMGVTPTGMMMSGAFLGSDAKELLDLNKRYMMKVNPLMKQLGIGTTYESLGSRKIGSTQVDEFAMNFDMSGPETAPAGALYGEHTRYALGITGGRLRFSMGDDTIMARVFAQPVTQAFADERYVKQALAGLPQRRNAVVLLDLAGLVAVAARATGQASVNSIPPGPPVAVSMSLAGEPARIDIHIPVSSIERAIQAWTPPTPAPTTQPAGIDQ